MNRWKNIAVLCLGYLIIGAAMVGFAWELSKPREPLKVEIVNWP